MDPLSSFAAFLPTKIAGDLSFFLLLVGGSLALSFALGRTRIVSVVLYSFAAFSFVGALPASFFAFMPESRAVIFLGILVVLVAVGDYIVDIHISNPSSTFFSRILVMGCLGSGLILSMLLSLLSRSFALQFISPAVYGYFTGFPLSIIWMAAPLLFLLFLNKRK